MDIVILVPWLSAAALIISIGTAIAAFVKAGSKENAHRIGALESKLEGVDRRVATIESELKHVPDRDAAHRLEMLVERLNGRIETLDERLKPVAAISERMQELLLEQAKR